MRRPTQSGFTLVELIIGVALLSTGMLVATMSYAAISKLQQKSATIRTTQQDGRYILEQISRDIRNAALIRTGNTGGVSRTLATINTQDIGGSQTYQWSADDQKLYRCIGSSACDASNGVSVGGDNLRITDASFEYRAASNTKPFVKVNLRVEQKSQDLAVTSVGSAVYDLSTTISPREVAPDAVAVADIIPANDTPATVTPGTAAFNGVKYSTAQTSGGTNFGIQSSAGSFSGQRVACFSVCTASYSLTYKGSQDASTFVINGSQDNDAGNPGAASIRVTVTSPSGSVTKILPFDTAIYQQRLVDISTLRIKDGQQLGISISFINDSCTACQSPPPSPSGDRNAYFDFFGITSGSTF